jgi:hypothetical protein
VTGLGSACNPISLSGASSLKMVSCVDGLASLIGDRLACLIVGGEHVLACLVVDHVGGLT